MRTHTINDSLTGCVEWKASGVLDLGLSKNRGGDYVLHNYINYTDNSYHGLFLLSL